MEKYTVAKYESSVNDFISLVEQCFPADGSNSFYKVSCYEAKTGGLAYESYIFEYAWLAQRKTAYISAMLQHVKNIENECEVNL